MAATEETADASLARDEYRRELGDGLLLRWSIPEDVERVATLAGDVFRHGADSPPNQNDAIWARDMFGGRHPHIGPRDFAVVEDTRTGTLVACACLLSQICEYEGISFRLGNPEIVATLPEHRRRGLIRAIFALIHAKSAARGHLVQGVTGIPYYYRQFGYEYAALLDDDGLTVYTPAIPLLAPGAKEPYTLREATLDEVPWLCQLWSEWARARAGVALWTTIDEDYWRWAMAGMHPQAKERWRVHLIVETEGGPNSTGGRPVGAVIERPGNRRGDVARGMVINADGPMVDVGVPLVRVMPSLLRGLRALNETVEAITLSWGGPALRTALGGIPFVEKAHPYAWYLRVADLPRFLRHIAPALERRLAESAQAGYTGELTLDFYRGGLRFAFERGSLTAVADWRVPLWGEAMAGFPPLVFLQALFGHRSLDELRAVFPDVWAEGDAPALLDALFPRRPSLLLPLD